MLVIALVAMCVHAVSAAPNAVAATIPTPVTCSSPAPVPGSPWVVSFTFWPRAVDVRTASRTVAVSVSVGNLGQDIRRVTATFASPTVAGTTRHATATLTRASGTGRHGIWSGTLTIPRWTIQGSWDVSSLTVADAGGGLSEYWAQYRSGNPTHWPTSSPHLLAVTSQQDVVPPTLSRLTFSKRSVSTRSTSATVTVRATTRDSLSGATAVSVVLANPNASGASAVRVGLTRTGGDRGHATFTGTLVVPRWVGSTPRIWRPSAAVVDRLGNRRDYSVADLEARGLSPALRVSSTTDVTAPTLATATFSPRAIDVRSIGRAVTYTVAARDAAAGVSRVTVAFTAPHRRTFSVSLTRIRGTVQNGVWTGAVRFPACFPEPGVWTASIRISDRAGQVSAYSPGSLAARHQPVSLAVQSIDQTAPYAEGPAGPVPVEGGVLLRFSEPVLLTEPAGALLQVDFAFTAGTFTCRNGAGTVVVCDADGANVRTIAFTPRDGPLTPGTPLDVRSTPTHDQHPGIYDTSGNELSHLPLIVFFTVAS